MPRKPVFGNMAGADNETIDRKYEFRMRCRRQLAVIGNLAGVPKPRDIGRGLGHPQDILVASGNVKHHLIFGKRRARQAMVSRLPVERCAKRRDGREVEIAVAPLQQCDRIETMVLERLDEILVERRAAARRAKCAVAHMAAGAAGDLAEFRRRQAAILPAVEFAVARRRRRDRRRD